MKRTKKAIIKTYVLMVAKVFPAYHPRKGEATEFRKKILSGEKIHTIRGNYELWKKRAEEINAGKAILSRREWEGRPYFSSQVEIDKLEKIEVQRIEIPKETLYPKVDGYFESVIEIAKNDGFECMQDFWDWFPNKFTGGIIHFTDFRY